jgi:hypothetical protein
MRYDYLQYCYHPRETAFEVAAILMDEDERAESPSKAVKETILSSHKYNHDGYILQRVLAFNPVTNQQATFELVGHERHIESRKVAFNNSKKAKKSWKDWFDAHINILHELEKQFAVVMNHLFGKSLKSQQNIPHHGAQYINFANEHKARKINIEQPAVKVQYTIHPHVDALINAHKHQNFGHGR